MQIHKEKHIERIMDMWGRVRFWFFFFARSGYRVKNIGDKTGKEKEREKGGHFYICCIL